MRYFLLNIALLHGSVIFVASQGYYSVLAPGHIQSNRNYTVLVSIHQSPEPVKVNVTIEGPTFEIHEEVFLNPFESKAITILPPKLTDGEHKLIVQGVSGLRFYNESELIEIVDAGPTINIQTDKAVYKPGDLVQFRVVLMDEHTRPLKISEPIRVEITDGINNRVKQFKDISFVKGVYKNQFQLSEYPVMGVWHIRVHISGRYDLVTSKSIKVQRYLLPKFSVYVETDRNIVLGDQMTVQALIYGQYTFEKYVEGQVKLRLVQDPEKIVLEERVMQIKDLLNLGIHLNNTESLREAYGINMEVELREKFTQQISSEKIYIHIHEYPYQISVLPETIKFAKGKPYQLTAKVREWNDLPLMDDIPLIMEHASRNYSVPLDANGEATFQFEHEASSDHTFWYGNVTYLWGNIFAYEPYTGNVTDLPLTLELLTEKPQFGSPVRIQVTSLKGMPYLVYTIVGHANFIYTEHIKLPTNPRTHILEITPSIAMIPIAVVYVHYIDGGNLRYSEIRIKFPLEFENKVFIMAPKQVKPGAEVNLEVRVQPKSLVGILAVDLGVYLLDPSYDFKKEKMLEALQQDTSRLPFLALVYPGLMSGVLTLTNAHYEFVPLQVDSRKLPDPLGELTFRKNFPETWIFENYEITNATTQLTLNIPDTVTTWRVTAFTMNEKTGFGIVDGPTDVTTIQPFFISLNLPYSVKRGEIVAIPILIHNYLNRSLDTEITLLNTNNEFYFMESTILNTETGSSEEGRTKNITMPANSVDTVLFYISPRLVGDIKLRITATNSITSDAIIDTLRVQPEGIKQEFNNPQYISVIPSEPVELSYPLSLPANMVPQSEFITLTVVGDDMVPVLLNLNDLLYLPTGCGEQNMANFAPNVLALQYLRSTGQYHREAKLVAKVKRNIEIGYQQQLTYRHNNGGYSVFGQRKDFEASTWLTAYTVRFFIKTLKYAMAIEKHIIETGLHYLATAQREDGSFPYTGYLLYPAQQNRFGFTAFVLMTFLEDEKYAQNYTKTIGRGLRFLHNHMDEINDLYALSIMAVTLQMAEENASSKKILDRLMQHKESDNESVWWSQNDRNMAKDVEITGYVLVAMLRMGYNKEDSEKAYKWLTRQRNKKGGFKSSHDTVVGLQALIQYPVKYKKSSGQINVVVNYKAVDDEKRTVRAGEISVDQSNAKILQTEELPKTTRALEIRLTGSGSVFLQVNYQYYINGVDSFEYFRLEPRVKLPNPAELTLEICFSYIEPNSDAINMVVMEVNLPSGISADEKDIDDLLENDIVQRIEMKNSATSVIMYSAQLIAANRNCLNIMAYKLHDVIHLKPVAIIIYDYYDISRHDTVFYELPSEVSENQNSEDGNPQNAVDKKKYDF